MIPRKIYEEFQGLPNVEVFFVLYCCGISQISYRICHARCIGQCRGELLEPFRLVYVISYKSEHQQCLFHLLRAAINNTKQILTIWK